MTKKMPKGGLTEIEVEELIRKGTDYKFSKTYEGDVDGQTTYKFTLELKPPFGPEAAMFVKGVAEMEATLKKQKGTSTLDLATGYAKALAPYIYVKGKLAGASFLEQLPYLTLIAIITDLTMAAAGTTGVMTKFRRERKGTTTPGSAPGGVQAVRGKDSVGVDSDAIRIPTDSPEDIEAGSQEDIDGRAGGEGKDNEHEADEGDVSKDRPGTDEGAKGSKQEGGE